MSVSTLRMRTAPSLQAQATCFDAEATARTLPCNFNVASPHQQSSPLAAKISLDTKQAASQSAPTSRPSSTVEQVGGAASGAGYRGGSGRRDARINDASTSSSWSPSS